jgi:hypothetical protein
VLSPVPQLSTAANATAPSQDLQSVPHPLESRHGTLALTYRDSRGCRAETAASNRLSGSRCDISRRNVNDVRTRFTAAIMPVGTLALRARER